MKNKKKTMGYKSVAGLLAALSMVTVSACGNTPADNGGSVEIIDSTGESTISEEGTPIVLEMADLPDYSGSAAWTSDLYVGAVEGIDNDFIRGVDVSSYISEIESGVVYKDFDGNVLDEKGFFTFLGEVGVNWVRIRIWNDPYDTKGNSYGGGHNDLDTAIQLGTWATEAGMKVLIDFHYSDFWADPSKQMPPKAWAHMTYADKLAAFGEYTEDAMNKILNAGICVGMVQVGNEITSGIAGETTAERKYELVSAGCNAVRKVAGERGKDIAIAIHFTNPQNSNFIDYAQELQEYGIDYDVFATSYYPYWHGTMEKLTNTLTAISETYGKKVMVAETSYAFTNDDSDGFSNSISYETSGVESPYDFSVQGQANEVHDVFNAVAAVGEAGLGVFYWEPAWITVGKWTDGASNAIDVYNSNMEKWETFGSGWASSFTKTYDTKDAGVWFGGSSWDNQAMFDADGMPLESINVFRYIYGGTTAELTVTGVMAATAEVGIGDEMSLPDCVLAMLLDGSTKEVDVVWNEDDINAVDTNVAGSYVIGGQASVDGVTYEVKCAVEVLRINFVKNPGFEEDDMSMWAISGVGVGRLDDNNKHSGKWNLHFWNESEFSYKAEQEIVGLPAGTYELSAFLQGGDAGSSAVFELYISVNGKLYTAYGSVTGWLNWCQPTVENIIVPEGAEVRIGVNVKCGAKGWGAWDDFGLYKAE